ncbi:MAG TPA: GTPase Era, partial [Thermodesulfovibrionales bacterium]|nr:GTPase Era [Thermodesulfovibrionales bacterium]
MNRDPDDRDFRSGYVSLIGRPNVGKSTLLNSILGEKVAIVTQRPQTTRNRIVGIKTLPDAQIIFMDTPGIHQPRNKLGEAMTKTAIDSLGEVDIVLFMVEARGPGKAEHRVMDLLKDMSAPVFLLVNKIDELKKPEVLPVIEKYREIYSFAEVIPISALTHDGLDILLD